MDNDVKKTIGSLPGGRFRSSPPTELLASILEFTKRVSQTFDEWYVNIALVQAFVWDISDDDAFNF